MTEQHKDPSWWTLILVAILFVASVVLATISASWDN